MKKIKRDNPAYPLELVLSDGTDIIVERQSKHPNTWLRKHGCPIFSSYKALQFLGIKDKTPTKILAYYRKHYGKYFRGTMTIRGLYKGFSSLIKGKGTAKFFPPEEITTARLTKYLKAGCFIIIVRRKPTLHYYTLVMDENNTLRLNRGKCDIVTPESQVKVKSNSKYYGGMIVVSRLGKSPHAASNTGKPAKKKPVKKPAKKKPVKKPAKKKKKKTYNQIAEEVLKDKWGKGEERKRRLKAAGYSYRKVQKLVTAKVRARERAKRKKKRK